MSEFFVPVVRYFCLSVVVAGCYSADFVYIEFDSGNLRALETGEPPGLFWYTGVSIPVRYGLIDDEVDLTITMGNETFIPDVIVRSSIPIAEVLATSCASVLPRSRYETIVKWSYWPEPHPSCLRIGDAVTMDIVLEGNRKVVTVVGTVRRSGSFRFSD
jgi:hypothetical protein